MRLPLLTLAAFCASLTAPARAADYYTLAITLPGAFCAQHPDRADSRECRNPQALGVHGLWPESFSGRAPQDCGHDAPRLSPGLQRNLDPVMPDAGLRRHEWQSHGSCSGLDAETYFSRLLGAYNGVKWPRLLTEVRGRDRVVERRLILEGLQQANPGLPARGVYLRCEGRGRPPLLSEIRICLGADGRYTDCGRGFKPNCPAAVGIKGLP